MLYRPKLPAKNNNVSHQHPFRELMLLLAAFLLFLLFCYWLLGLFVDYAADKLSPKLEQQLFSRFVISAKASPEQQKLQQLVEQLQPCAVTAYPVQVHYINDPMINAAVLPGGTMLVYQGLLNNIDTENGLMFVLAHELAHLKNRDHLRSMGRGLVMAALTYSMTGSNQLSQLFTPAVDLGMAQHSQQRERAADATALDILHCYYGHVGGADNFFRSMLKNQKLSALPGWFDSHPQLTERLQQLNVLVQQKSYPQLPPVTLPAELLQ